MYDAIVVGGGPAGLAAGAWLLGRGLDIRLVSRTTGGHATNVVQVAGQNDLFLIKAKEQVAVFKQLVSSVPDVLVDGIVENLTRMDQKFQVTVSVSGTKETIEARSVILANGIRWNFPTISGAKEYWGHGLSTNAQSYAPTIQGGTVLVHGNGERAAESALELSFFADHVYLSLASGTLLAKNLQDQLSTRNVETKPDSVVSLLAGDQKALTHAVLESADFSEKIAITHCFLEPEAQADLDFLAIPLTRDRHGLILVDRYLRSSVAGLFAAGDIAGAALSQVALALSEGVAAAASAQRWLRNKA